MAFDSEIDLSERVPLFPLPNVVLLPRAILPLHIFEKRYSEMMTAALSGSRLIAMALLKPGWEKGYQARPAVEDAVCVGRILQHERLADGRYNLLLQGICRATIESIDDEESYRRAELTRIVETDVMEIDLAEHRRKLKRLFEEGRVGESTLTQHLTKLFDSPVSTSDLVDVLSFSLITDVNAKQQLLADGDVIGRVRRAVQWLSEIHPEIPRDAQRRTMGDMN